MWRNPEPRSTVAPIGATSARDRGVWCIKGTCVPVQAIIDNARDGFTAEQIATEIFALPVDVMRRILRDLYSANVLLTRYSVLLRWHGLDELPGC
jgi:uncharacterized protein (DUF433 family)